MFHLRALSEYPYPLSGPAHLYLQCSLLFLPGLQSLPFVPPSRQLIPPHLTSQQWILSVKKKQITNPPTLKAFSFHACIFLACKGVSAITLSFHGIVSKPVSVHYEYLPKGERTSSLLAAHTFCDFLPSLSPPPLLTSPSTSSPLHVMSPFESFSTVAVTSACSSHCLAMRKQAWTPKILLL